MCFFAPTPTAPPLFLLAGYSALLRGPASPVTGWASPTPAPGSTQGGAMHAANVATRDAAGGELTAAAVAEGVAVGTAQ